MADVGAYKPPAQSKSAFLEILSESLSIYLDIYGNVMLLGDFNMTPEDKKTFNYLQILKTKIIRANNHEFITKALQKATMTRFRLKTTI